MVSLADYHHIIHTESASSQTNNRMVMIYCWDAVGDNLLFSILTLSDTSAQRNAQWVRQS